MANNKKILLEKHKDIARIDQEEKRTHGWYVRVRYMGKTHSKFFSDRKCGGRYSSLLSALAWRDKTEADLGKVRTDKQIVTVSNSKTGVVGVRLNEKLNRYEVSWVTDTGKQGCRSCCNRIFEVDHPRHLHGQIFNFFSRGDQGEMILSVTVGNRFSIESGWSFQGIPLQTNFSVF